MDDDVVVILTCDGDKSSTEGSGSDSDSDLDSEDDLVIDDLENMKVQVLLKLRAVEMKKVKVRQMKIFQIMKEKNEGNRAMECFERQFYVNLHILFTTS